MKKIVPKHPLAIRWFHWINFPVLAIMIWSGLMIYWANDVYSVRVGGKALIKFFPQSFYDALHLPFRLAEGMAFHFVLMWLFFINGLLYVLYTFFSGEWRLLLPNRYSFKEAWQVLLHDLYLRKGVPPAKKYNGAQRIAYSAIIVMGIGSVITGLSIYKPIQFGWLCSLCGGYAAARIEHFILTIGYCLFFVIHILQVIRAGWNNFRGMVAGFEVVHVDPVPAPLPNGGPIDMINAPVDTIPAGQVETLEPGPTEALEPSHVETLPVDRPEAIKPDPAPEPPPPANEPEKQNDAP
jgi:thiosulfate reductase cytochrome b subunit